MLRLCGRDFCIRKFQIEYFINGPSIYLEYDLNWQTFHKGLSQTTPENRAVSKIILLDNICKRKMPQLQDRKLPGWGVDIFSLR